MLIIFKLKWAGVEHNHIQYISFTVSNNFVTWSTNILTILQMKKQNKS